MSTTPALEPEAISRLSTGNLAAVAAKLRSGSTARLAGEYFWIVSGQVVSAVGGLVGVRILTGALPPSIYGQLALAMTLAMFAQTTVFMPLTLASTRYFAPSQENGRMRAYLGSVRHFLTRGAALVSLLAISGAGTLLLTGQSKWLPLLLATYLFSLTGVGSVVDGIQNAARQRQIVSLHQAAGQWLRPILAVVMVRLLLPTSTNAMLGYALASLLVLASQAMFFKWKIVGRSLPADRGAVDLPAMRRKMMTYAWPFAIFGVLGWLRSASDRWALQTFADAGSVGLYAAAFQLGYYPMMFISGSFVALVGPILFAAAGEGKSPARLMRTHRMSGWLVSISLAVTAGFTLLSLLFHRQVYAYLVAPQYRVTSAYWPLLLLAGGFWASGQSASYGLFALTDTKRLVVPNTMLGVLGIAANILGAALWGIRGVVLGVLGFAFLHCAVMSLMLYQFGMRLRSDGRPLVTAESAPPSMEAGNPCL